MNTLYLIGAFIAAFIAISVDGAPQDSTIHIVQPLTEEEKQQPPPRDSGRSIYLANLLPAPPSENSTHPRSLQDLRDPNRKQTALFLLQRVNDNGHLPDGIYYRPAKGEQEPPPIVQANISRLHEVILGRTPRIRFPERSKQNNIDVINNETPQN